MKIAFIGYKKQEKYSIGSPKDEDKVLMDLFLACGLDIHQVVWNDPGIVWQDYQVAILKSPWDYHEKFPEFTTWLQRLNALGITLLNPHEIVMWNSDKRYLADIERGGLPVIPSVFFEKNERPDLGGFFGKFGSGKLVIKPCVSASAKNTLIVSGENLAEHEALLHVFLRDEPYLVQPFMEEIGNGELSMIFLGNEYSHAVLKLPKAGDFRVQHFHGGTIKKFSPGVELIREARKYVDRYAKGCLYARVDGILSEKVFRLMELELIEPYLFLDSEPSAYENYYRALMQLMKQA